MCGSLPADNRNLLGSRVASQPGAPKSHCLPRTLLQPLPSVHFQWPLSMATLAERAACHLPCPCEVNVSTRLHGFQGPPPSRLADWVLHAVLAPLLLKMQGMSGLRTGASVGSGAGDRRWGQGHRSLQRSIARSASHTPQTSVTDGPLRASPLPAGRSSWLSVGAQHREWPDPTRSEPSRHPASAMCDTFHRSLAIAKPARRSMAPIGQPPTFSPPLAFYGNDPRDPGP